MKPFKEKDKTVNWRLFIPMLNQSCREAGVCPEEMPGVKHAAELKPVKEKDKTELKLDILEFAQEHNLVVHPDKDLDRFCESTVTYGHCICRDNELYCPCEQALPLCLTEGHCTCRLFITREAYPIELAKYRGRWRKKHEH